MAANETVDQVEGLFSRLETALKNGQAKRSLKAADESEWRCLCRPRGLCLMQTDLRAGQYAVTPAGAALTWFAIPSPRPPPSLPPPRCSSPQACARRPGCAALQGSAVHRVW